jgi:putative endonuclease
MQNNRQEFGRTGETLACRYLEENGYVILARNYRTKFGEIDIIARDMDTLVFIEVKSRRSNHFGNPKYAVNKSKQKKISMAALHYLKDTKQSNVRARFDVVSLVSISGEICIEIVRNAFELAWGF